MSKTTSYKPTSDEEESIDRAGLNAAWAALQPLKNDNLPIQQMVMTCLRAFSLARESTINAENDLLKKHPESDYIAFCPSVTNIVCSALFGINLGIDSPDGISPNSIGGARIAVLLQAAKALDGMSTLYSAFDDDEVFGIYLAKETEKFGDSCVVD